MKLITLNKCLSKLDTIIFGDIDNYKDGIEIRDILNYVRQYIINSVEDKKYNKQSFMLILEFINYLIQESYKPIPHLSISRIKGLRFLIIKFEDNRLYISDKEIDLDNECYTFLRKIRNNNGNDYGGDNKDNEGDDKDGE